MDVFEFYVLEDKLKSYPRRQIRIEIEDDINIVAFNPGDPNAFFHITPYVFLELMGYRKVDRKIPEEILAKITAAAIASKV